MFSKILIANRGEIACRVMRTARRLGIRTVAVYSDADASAMHVREADEAVHIGPSPVSESYLQSENIIRAALTTGAQAIHPGYGFLSENPDFVEAVEAAGLVFIGPSAAAIRAMGLKDAAKALMEKAKVPVVPGYHGDMQEPGFLAAKANEIGYPVLIKARAGGGGKGMRKVDEAKQFSAALASCRSEARSSFGDSHVLIEKYVANPRHIEVQVFGDSHGNVVHLYERDCSLQRRHQKVIEEAPAPGMTAEMREAMTSAAVKAAKAINYANAGTIEFIVDGSGPLRPDGFWFMEMNTRLQVEHPVTEEVTGLDLVEWQLRVAAGEPLPLKQDEVRLNGHAFEARLYAEDVPKGFLPATGTLHHLALDESARNDTGVAEGDTITPFYDPMIAKVITRGETRETALMELAAALRHTRIAGTVTNRAFLEALCANEEFSSGKVDTGLIERQLDKLTAPTNPTPETAALAALIASFGDDITRHCVSPGEKNAAPYAAAHNIAVEPFAALGGFALWGGRSQFADILLNDELKTIRVQKQEYGKYRVDLPAGAQEIMLRSMTCSISRSNCHPVTSGLADFEMASGRHKAWFARWHGKLAVFADDGTFEFATPDPLEASEGEAGGAGKILAPMPGLVKKVFAAAGDEVEKGTPILVLEAMKMEHTLAAPRDGKLSEVMVAEGDQVEDGTLLAAMEEE